jgi:hypothetical protein
MSSRQVWRQHCPYSYAANGSLECATLQPMQHGK